MEAWYTDCNRQQTNPHLIIKLTNKSRWPKFYWHKRMALKSICAISLEKNKSEVAAVTGWPLHCLSRELLPLRLSIKESFLGKASSLLGFGCLAMHDNSPGSLCHATRASAWGYSSRVPCLTGLVCACGVATLGLCQASLGDLWESGPFC
jgi:hypothetical protein